MHISMRQWLLQNSASQPSPICSWHVTNITSNIWEISKLRLAFQKYAENPGSLLLHMYRLLIAYKFSYHYRSWCASGPVCCAQTTGPSRTWHSVRVVLQSSRRHTDVNSVRSPVYSVSSAVSRPRSATTTISTAMLVVVAHCHNCLYRDIRRHKITSNRPKTLSYAETHPYASVDV